MKTNTAVATAIQNDYAVYAQPKLIADWNLNRYYSPVAENILPEEDNGFDTEAFPIKSIVEPNRPSGGIQKARIGHSIVSDSYKASVTPRFYLSSDEDVYKYWTSPEPSNSSGNFRNHTDGKSIVRPYVTYSGVVRSNKIVIKMNVGWAKPSSFNITVGTGGTWRSTPISTSPSISNNGTVTLYYNGTGWSTTKPAALTSYDTFDSIMLTVNSLTGGTKLDGTPMTYQKSIGSGVYTTITTNGSNSYFDLISIEAHYEADLSDRLISVTDTFDMSEVSALYPLGTVTSNIGNITLSNEDGIFNTESDTSVYRDILDDGVEFNLSYIYTIEGSPVEIQQFRMFGGVWQGQRDVTVNVALTDYSKYLQTTFPQPALWENLSVREVVARLLDSVGFVDFDIAVNPKVQDHLIPAFYVTGDKSVWEELGELAVGTQSAIYFDGWNRLQVKTRTAAFNNLKDVDWTFYEKGLGAHLPDIINFNQDEDLGANKAIIRYQATKWSKTSTGIPMLERVWEPEDTVVLRATPLATNLGANASMAYISKDDIKIWPWKGMFQVGGEIIEFEGKEYVWFDEDNGGTRTVSVLTSEDDKEEKDKKTPGNKRYKNHFTGGLAITERGKWDSEVRAHRADTEDYSVRSVINGTPNNNSGGFHHIPKDSTVQLYGGGRFKDYNDLLVATVGNTDDTGFYVYGTRFKFEDGNGYTGRRAGIVINNNASEDGYFIDIMSSFKLDGKERAIRNEVVVYTKQSGKYKQISSGGGGRAAIQDNVWYDLDVFFKVEGNNHILTVFLGGRKVERITISGTDKVSVNGRFGMFVRGDTKATFEYLYAIKNTDPDDVILEPEDDLSWYQMITTGYNGGLWDREWVYGVRTYWSGSGKDRKKRKKRLNQRFFDDFGPYLHEVREYDVKFDPAPVQSSRLFSTNDWHAIAMEYTGTPFGGHFVVCNTSRENAVLNGEDNLTFRQQNSGIQQALTVYGHVLNFADETTVKAVNEDGIQRRGKIEVELTSPWIQSRKMAKDVADWMMEHWGIGVESVSLEVFGNPLIEVGDVVRVNYPTKEINAKFFVTGVNTSFEAGLSTILTLRRVR